MRYYIIILAVVLITGIASNVVVQDKFFVAISRGGKRSIPDAYDVLSKTFPSLKGDEDVLNPLRIAEAILGYESSIKKETNVNGFSFAEYFHSSIEWGSIVDQKVCWGFLI
jgi:hypothetical protein